MQFLFSLQSKDWLQWGLRVGVLADTNQIIMPEFGLDMR